MVSMSHVDPVGDGIHSHAGKEVIWEWNRRYHFAPGTINDGYRVGKSDIHSICGLVNTNPKGSKPKRDARNDLVGHTANDPNPLLARGRDVDSVGLGVDGEPFGKRCRDGEDSASHEEYQGKGKSCAECPLPHAPFPLYHFQAVLNLSLLRIRRIQ